MSQMKKYDLIIIGGGRASNMALPVAKSGKKVALIESEQLGGTCPNKGCVPSKLLIGHSDLLYSIRRAKEFGVELNIEAIDREKIFADNKNWITKVDARYEGRLSEHVDIFRGIASFRENNVIAVGEELLHADRIVIGTGSRSASAPKTLQEKLHRKLWTSEDIFPIEDLDCNSIAIVGGGIIAVEMGAFFHAIGVSCTLLVRGDKLLKNEDSEIQKVFQTAFTAHVPTRLNTSITEIRDSEKSFELTLKQGENSSMLNVDRVLFATGRIPNSDRLTLENTDIQVNDRGFIQVDDYLQTAAPGVSALGDVVGNHMFQHSASFEARYIQQQILNNSAHPIDYGMMPHAVYSEPEIASVGAVTNERDALSEDLFSVFVDFKSSARALGMKIEDAGAKIVFDSDGRIHGCHIVGPGSSILIHQVLTAIQAKQTVYDLHDMIYIHPALSEVVFSAAGKAVSYLQERS